MATKLSGIFAPICTPFIDEELSVEHLKKNMQKYSKTPLAGYYVLGSNGENKSLTEDEKVTILKTVIEGKGQGQVVMAGSGYESTRQSIEFSKRAEELGADYVTLLTPSYFKKRMTDDAVIGYYTDVADAVSIPVLIYNAPGFTGLTISPAVVKKLAAHPNIVGMKDTSPGNIGKYLSVAGDGFEVLSGTINTLLIGMVLGARGGVVSLANSYPEKSCMLYEKIMEGDMKKALELHYMLFRLNSAISGKFGVAGVKYAMEIAGYYGGTPRLPLLPLTSDDKQSIKKAIIEEGLA